METPQCKVTSWRKSDFYCSPEVASHENWAILSLIVLSYFVWASTWI